jgi:hypothetical protein
LRPKPITYAREVYSPSQLEMANRCLRSWVLRYVYGIKTQSAASRSKALGTLIHKCVELYVNGRSMLSLSVDDFDDYTRKEFTAFTAHREQALFDKTLKKNPYADLNETRTKSREGAQKELEALFREAPQRALAGLAHLPPLEQCAARFAEVPLQVSTTDFYDYDVEFSEMCKIDLVVQAQSGEWYLYDHKSTKGGKRTWTEIDVQVNEEGDTVDVEVQRSVYDPWLYVPTPEALKRNVQLLLYAAHVMQKQKVGELWCRWIYYYTGEGAPDSKPVDVHITYAEVAEYLQPWLELADKLGWIIRDTLEKNQLPDLAQFEFSEKINTDDSPCDAYGGCGYRGSHCNPPPLSAADILARTRAVKRESKGAESMSLDHRVAQMQANGAPVLPSVTPMQNPPGFQYTPNVNGQFVVAPPGHPAHAGVPAGYQYPPGAVPVAGGAVEVPQQQIIQATIAPPFSQTPHTPSSEEVDAWLAANPPPAHEESKIACPMPVPLLAPEPEKPKRTRRTKAEIEAEKAAGREAFFETAKDVPIVDGPLASGGLDHGIIVTREGSDLTHVVGIADAALEALSQKSKSLGCDVQVNFSFKGSQS